jgi:hypothetical protein
MQKTAIRTNLALYQDIENIQKKLNMNSQILGILNKLQDAAKQDKKYWSQLGEDAKNVKNEFVKKANEIGANVEGSENMQIINNVIDRSNKNEQKMDIISQTINSLFSELSR